MKLATGVAAVVIVAGWGGIATADTSTDQKQRLGETSAEIEPFRSKKDRALDDKVANEAAETDDQRAAWHKQLDKQLGKKPKKIINIFNTWTHEFVVVDFKSKDPQHTGETADQFLRCHFTDEPAEMDKRLFRVLVDAANHFGSQRVDIVSGFRAPKYNLMLRKKGRGVARNSQHPLGNAVDFRVEGVATAALRSWAQSLRIGGVGYYPSSGFVHVDTGRVRNWTDK